VYEVFLERAAERDLKRLDSRQFDRVVERLKGLALQPRPPGAGKIKGSKNDWRIRVGSLRIIYEVDEEARALRVMRVRSRRRAYH
jgi:mRNA interferase RelE/StbE